MIKHRLVFSIDKHFCAAVSVLAMLTVAQLLYVPAAAAAAAAFEVAGVWQPARSSHFGFSDNVIQQYLICDQFMTHERGVGVVCSAAHSRMRQF